MEPENKEAGVKDPSSPQISKSLRDSQDIVTYDFCLWKSQKIKQVAEKQITRRPDFKPLNIYENILRLTQVFGGVPA